MPFIIIPFFIIIFYSRPGHAVRGFFTAGITATIVFIFILLPGAIKGFFIDFLGVRRRTCCTLSGKSDFVL
jgi:hypothetical protein